MSDTLCGPSNALQSMQKHTSADRTLQQDRAASHHHLQEVSLGFLVNLSDTNGN